MARTCPECGDTLRAEEILGITLDICPGCAGIWFDDGELLKLKDLGDEAIDQVEDDVIPEEAEPSAPKESRRLCPDCQAGMEEYSYLYTTQIKLDSCPRCHGTWVEDGELARMREALEEARLHPENVKLNRQMEHQVRALAGSVPPHPRHVVLTKFLKLLSLRRA